MPEPALRFLTLGLDLTREEQSLLETVHEALGRLTQRRKGCLPISSGLDAVLREVILYRIVAMASGTIVNWNTTNVLCSFLSARALFETFAFLWDYDRAISEGRKAGTLAFRQNEARSIDMEFLIVTLLGLFLTSLPIYGLLRLGIYIGAQRAVDNIIFGFMSAGRDHSELQETTKALKLAIARRNCWYGLFGVSKADWYKNKTTADIGDRLEFLAFEGGRLYQRRMEEM